MSLVNPTRQIWVTKQQKSDFNPPVLNTLHEVIHELAGCRIVCIEVRQTNTPTNAEEIDILITQDGNSWLYDASVVGVLTNNVKYGVKCMPYNVDEPAYNLDVHDYTASTIPFIVSDNNEGKSSELEGVNVLVQVRQTSAIAAAARIMVKITYKVLETI